MKTTSTGMASNRLPLRLRLRKLPRAQRGGALVEYVIVVLALLLVLVANPNAIQQLLHALRDAYTSFVYALSVSWI